MDKKAILIFGVGELQKSIILRAKVKGLFVVGIDPCKEAVCRDIVDAFEVVGGQDFEGTLAVARKYNISAVVTAATDKPLVMMAKVAKELGLRFYSEETAQISTDKYLMKEKFLKAGIPCAEGRLISTTEEAEGLFYPVIVKPRDNSGSRGVRFCKNKSELEEAINEASQYTSKSSVLVEEFVEGQEYSIESLHYDGKNEIIQFTEKKTTPFPYNVELGHIQPANLSDSQKEEIRSIINRIGECLKFEHCASHTELKINDRGIFIIETSPRLGGDYITSTLVPLSTGINMEDQLLNILTGGNVDLVTNTFEKASGVSFFSYPKSVVKSISLKKSDIVNWKNMIAFSFNLKEGDTINIITSSLDRYGQFIVEANDRNELEALLNNYEKKVGKYIILETK